MFRGLAQLTNLRPPALRALLAGLCGVTQDPVLHGNRATLSSMANLTLTIDRETLQRARIRALERGTSVNAVVRSFLERYAGESPAQRAISQFLELAARSDAGSGPGGRQWTREDLRER